MILTTWIGTSRGKLLFSPLIDAGLHLMIWFGTTDLFMDGIKLRVMAGNTRYRLIRELMGRLDG